MTLTRTFAALSDDTRLALLDQLRSGPSRAGDLAARHPHLSRPAVSRHLRVLRTAGLVRETSRGTERWYALDPTPLIELEQQWLPRYRTWWQTRLDDLATLAEEE